MRHGSGSLVSLVIASSLKELADDGYIFVFQDIRGKFKSEGEFVMIRPPRDPDKPKAIDEGTDAFDSIDWLIKNVPGHNGRVGMGGVSYDGWLTVMALHEPHPALKAASAQASPADMFLGDDFHHNGAFRLSYGFEYAAMMETGRTVQQFRFDQHDTFEWFLDLGALSSANTRYFHGKIPTWNDFAGHPNYDPFWQKQAVARFLTGPKVPTLNVAGWWDQEDFYGPLKIYETWEKQDSSGRNTLVVGPWNHGGWSHGVGDRLGPIKFDLSYETEPLAQDLDVAGTVLVRLFASTSGTDCDWIVKLIDRNPQKFVPNIFEAKATDYQTATQRVYRAPGRATHLELSVMPAESVGTDRAHRTERGKVSGADSIFNGSAED